MPGLAAATVFGHPNNPQVRHGVDDNLFVRFYHNPVTDLDHIEINVPGDKHFRPDRPVTEEDKLRFERQWKAYSEGLDEFEGQTLLEDVAWVDVGTRRLLNSISVFTVDGLAAVNDGNLRHVGHGARTLRERARKFVAERDVEADKAATDARFDELAAQLAELRQENEKLRGLIPPTAEPVETTAPTAAPAAAEAQIETPSTAEQRQRRRRRSATANATPPAEAIGEQLAESDPEIQARLAELGVEHVGGPWFKLPNGRKVKGITKAIDEAAKLAQD